MNRGCCLLLDDSDARPSEYVASFLHMPISFSVEKKEKISSLSYQAQKLSTSSPFLPCRKRAEMEEEEEVGVGVGEREAVAGLSRQQLGSKKVLHNCPSPLLLLLPTHSLSNPKEGRSYADGRKVEEEKKVGAAKEGKAMERRGKLQGRCGKRRFMNCSAAAPCKVEKKIGRKM